MEYVLQTNQLSKRYGKHQALDKVSIHVRKGEIYGLIGKNGAGKSTLFKVIMGLAKQSSGEVRLFHAKTENERNEAKHRMGFMMEANFFPYLTAKQNLEFFRKLKGIADKNEVDRVLKLVEMDGIKKPFKSFSMGMKQRVAIANAMMGNPDLVLLDEPINGLDPQGIADFRKLVQKLNQERQMTFLVSSHILGELGMMATRFGFIHEGKLVEEIDRETIHQKTQERVVIKVNDVELGSTLLERTFEKIRYHVNGDQEFVIMDHTDEVDTFVELFTSNGLKVSKVQPQERTLEEYYLELIKKGENANVAVH